MAIYTLANEHEKKNITKNNDTYYYYQAKVIEAELQRLSGWEEILSVKTNDKNNFVLYLYDTEICSFDNHDFFCGLIFEGQGEENGFLLQRLKKYYNSDFSNFNKSYHYYEVEKEIANVKKALSINEKNKKKFFEIHKRTYLHW